MNAQKRRSLAIRITKTNLPFDSAVIRFRLSETHGRTVVTVSPHYRLRFGVFGKILDHLIVSRRYPARNPESTERFKVVCREVTQERRRAIGPKRRMVIGCASPLTLKFRSGEARNETDCHDFLAETFPAFIQAA